MAKQAIPVPPPEVESMMRELNPASMATEPELIKEEDTENDSRASRTMDPELRIMGAILRQLENLDAEGAARVMEYVYARFKKGI